MKLHQRFAELLKVNLFDTGEESMTGSRHKGISKYIWNEEVFCFAYGYEISDINIDLLMKFHKMQGVKATLTAVHPQKRFEALDIANHKVTTFKEKPKVDGDRINGGFFVLSPTVLQ